jgi:hypothetical protein
MSTAVRDSWREIEDDTWIIGGKIKLVRGPAPLLDSSWIDDDGTYFTAFEADKEDIDAAIQHPAPKTPFKLVYDAWDAHAVWQVGNAFVKVAIIAGPLITREYVTLAAVHAMLGLGFRLPNVIYHDEKGSRYFLIMSRVVGEKSHKVWPSLSVDERGDCVGRVAKRLHTPDDSRSI